MSDDPTLEGAVDFWAAEPDNTDEMIARVSKHGYYDNTSFKCFEVECGGETRYFHAPTNLSAEHRHRIEEFMCDYNPRVKECFANAVELCRFDERFDYVEGVTTTEEKTAYDHAWNEVDGVPIDVTRSTQERYGICISNESIRDVVSVLEDNNQWNVIENPHTHLETVLSLNVYP